VAVCGGVFCFAGTLTNASEGRRTNFLSNGPSSVGGALGGAMTGRPDDSSAVYWNPAGLVGQKTSVFVDHENTNEEVSTSWLGFAGGNPLLKYGLNWKHQQLPLDTSKDAILIGLGIDQSVISWLPRLPGLSFGTTLGRVGEKIMGTSASTYLLDVGALWRGGAGPWRLSAGAAIKNLYFGGLSFDEGNGKEKWPQELRTGLTVNRFGVTGLLDVRSVDSKIEPLYGLEYELVKIIYLRAGYNGDGDVSYGIGMKFKNLGLAFGSQPGVIQDKMSGSVSYTWGPKEKVDYTNPLTELESRHRNLESYLLTEVRSDIQSGKKPDLKKVFQLLAVAPKNDDAWVLIGTLTGEKKFSASIPHSKRVRRDYLSFAVAFANGEPEAKSNGDVFIKKHPRASASKIIHLIRKYNEEAQPKP